MAASVVTGCSSKKDDASSGSDGEKRIVKFDAFSGGNGEEVWKEMAKAFEAKNKDEMCIRDSYYTYEEASAHVMDDDVHLWILDIMLDDKSGFDLIEEIRLQGRDIPVIFMSARDKEFDRIIGLEKGSDDYITKPFSPCLLYTSRCV